MTHDLRRTTHYLLLTTYDFAGYSGQMSELLDKVNPGLKSRVSDVIDFPDFSPAAAAQIARQQLAQKRLTLPAQMAPALELCMERLVAAPRWANGRDVETFVRRVAVECATRQASEARPCMHMQDYTDACGAHITYIYVCIGPRGALWTSRLTHYTIIPPDLRGTMYVCIYVYMFLLLPPIVYMHIICI